VLNWNRWNRRFQRVSVKKTKNWAPLLMFLAAVVGLVRSFLSFIEAFVRR
jgi:hypothetical protein